MRLAVVLFLLAPGGQDPFEEAETSAEKHLKSAETAESAELFDRAFYHYERVIDTCAATDEQGAAARERRHAVQEHLPANADEKKAAPWRVLAVVCRAYTLKTGDLVASYRLSDATIKALKEGVTAFEKTVWESSRGAMKASVTFMPLEDPVKSLRREDNGSWMDIDEFERNFPKIKPKDGEFDQVFVYMVGDAKQSIPFLDRARWMGRWKYARAWNFMLAADDVKGDGEIETHHFLRSLRGTLERCAGYNPRLVPDVGENPRNGCCQDKKGMEWYRHILLDHITTRMYQEAPPPLPQGPYLSRFVLVSERYPNTDDKGLDNPHINELNLESDLKGWQPLKAGDDVININKHFSPNAGVRATCYLATYVTVKKGQWARLMFGSTDMIKLFVNGAEVGKRTERPDTAEPDDWAFRFHLKDGRNFLLIKSASNDNPWHLVARLTDAKGNPLRADVGPARK